MLILSYYNIVLGLGIRLKLMCIDHNTVYTENLAVCLSNHQIKIRQNFLFTYIRMAILYRTAKFKYANMFAMAIWDPTAKFNSRQYFRLYGI